MSESPHVVHKVRPVTRDSLIALLNEDRAGEFQAIIAYVIHSKILKEPQYMHNAAELEIHAAEELAHARTTAGQIDYPGETPQSVLNLVRTSTDARELLKFDLNNENEMIARYRERIDQCEELDEYALAELIRDILVQEQKHPKVQDAPQHDLTIEPRPEVARGRKNGIPMLKKVECGLPAGDPKPTPAGDRSQLRWVIRSQLRWVIRSQHRRAIRSRIRPGHHPGRLEGQTLRLPAARLSLPSK